MLFLMPNQQASRIPINAIYMYMMVKSSTEEEQLIYYD